MNQFLVFCVELLIFVALLGGLYWLFEQITLPQPVKVIILIIISCVGLLYFLQSGTLPAIGKI
jgi:hypothetical protein